MMFAFFPLLALDKATSEARVKETERDRGCDEKQKKIHPCEQKTKVVETHVRRKLCET